MPAYYDDPDPLSFGEIDPTVIQGKIDSRDKKTGKAPVSSP